jgi:hypothetical protein
MAVKNAKRKMRNATFEPGKQYDKETRRQGERVRSDIEECKMQNAACNIETGNQ